MQVLLSCSHMCCCTVCSRAVKTCPICNNKVSSVIDIRPVGMPPSSSSSLLAQNGTTDGRDWSAVGNSASSIGSTLLEVSNGGNQSREGPSRPSGASSRSQGSESVGFESSSAKPGNQHHPFRHVASDQPPPGIPVPKQSSFPGVSASVRSASSQSMTPSNVSSSGIGRPLFLPSDFFPSAMSGTSAPGTLFSPEGFQDSALSSSEWTGVNGSARNVAAAAAASNSVAPGRRPPAPYRPPGLYRPPDLFARSAPLVVAQSKNSSVVPGFASVVPPQWRTYQ